MRQVINRRPDAMCDVCWRRIAVGERMWISPPHRMLRDDDDYRERVYVVIRECERCEAEPPFPDNLTDRDYQWK